MNWFKYLFFGSAFMFAVSTVSEAQVMVDMSKFTCNQLLGGTPDAVEAAIWTSGYYNGLRKNTMLDLKVMKHNADAVVAACKDKPNETLMKAVDAVIDAGKKK
jgi:HdeA/HdeB family